MYIIFLFILWGNGPLLHNKRVPCFNKMTMICVCRAHVSFYHYQRRRHRCPHHPTLSLYYIFLIRFGSVFMVAVIVIVHTSVTLYYVLLWEGEEIERQIFGGSNCFSYSRFELCIRIVRCHWPTKAFLQPSNQSICMHAKSTIICMDIYDKQKSSQIGNNSPNTHK